MLSDLHKKVMSGSLARLKKKMAMMEKNESPMEESAETPEEESMENRLGVEGDIVKEDGGFGDESVNGNENLAQGADGNETGQGILDDKAIQKLLKGDEHLGKKPRGIVKVAMGMHVAKKMRGRPKKMG